MAIQQRRYSGNVLALRPGIGSIARLVLESLPFLGDLIHERYLFPRTSTSCRGVFASMAEARAAIPADIHAEYDICNEARSVENDISREFDIAYEDYPVLYWLQPLMRPGVRVVDVGGSTGGAFYAFSKYLSFPSDMQWLVAELPGAVTIGKQVASARGESRLIFVDALSRDHRPDVLLTMGTLQYMPQRLPEILTASAALPSHVVVHRVPVTDGPSYWTIQNLGIAQVPYHIQNREELTGSVEALGYRMIDSCYTLRGIRIPHHPTHDVQHYAGFRFSLPEAR